MNYRYVLSLPLILTAILLTGCAGSSEVKTAAPAAEGSSQELSDGVSNDYFDAILSLQWSQLNPCCSEFHLFVKNNTDKSMTIEWDKTFYVHAGVTMGKFLFPASACEKADMPKAPHVIPPHGALTKVIWPEKLAHLEGPNGVCLHDPMEPGKNGIRLTVKSSEAEVNEQIMLDTSTIKYPHPQ